MDTNVAEISTLEELRNFVHETICDRQQLLSEAFPLHVRVLTRNGRPCGQHFLLFGPRAVQFSAIWNANGGTILFYDCNGDRFHRCDLLASRRLQEELAGITGWNKLTA